MIRTIKSAVFARFASERYDYDVTWYGTLGVLAACLGVLPTMFFAG
jgi:hypothetical protein